MIAKKTLTPIIRTDKPANEAQQKARVKAHADEKRDRYIEYVNSKTDGNYMITWLKLYNVHCYFTVLLLLRYVHIEILASNYMT